MKDYEILKLLHTKIKTGPYAHITFEEKFWCLVNKRNDNECWEFIGGLYPNKYGDFSINKIDLLAHRVSFLLYNGFLTEGFLVMHSCDNPRCVNPKHLKLGTYSDNAKDMISKNRGNHPKGEKSYRAKLSEKDVIEIRKKRNAGISCKEIAKDYTVSRTQISRVSTGQRWGWLH